MHVTLVSTPPDAFSGTGQYTAQLTDHVGEQVTVELVFIETDSANPVHFIRQALYASATDTDVIHIQYDYVVFGPLGLYTFLFFGVLALTQFWKRTPIVVTVHEVLNRDLVVPPLVRIKAAYTWSLNRVISRVADHLIFLSPQSKNRFQASVTTGPTTCLPHGTQLRLPSDTITDRETAREVFGYQPDDVVVVEPGYVSRRKGSDVFVALARRCPEYKFLLAGGPARERLAGFVEELERRAPENLTITGQLTDTDFHAAIATADVAVLPYRETAQTGVINTVNQSGVFNWCASHGVPTAATDCEHFRALAEQWGCPALFDVTDLSEVERVVEAIVTDEERRRELSNAIADYAHANDMSTVADQHVELYREVIR